MPKPHPYNGSEPFIFISYSHKDGNAVHGVISKMQSDGYRVWYDKGIDPGSEWDEMIANKIEKSGYFIAFISENYLGSENCKDELNFARDLDKKRLLIYLEDVTLPAGMRMRLNRLQALFRHKYSVEDEFFVELYKAEDIEHFCSPKKPLSTREAPKTVKKPPQKKAAKQEKPPVSIPEGLEIEGGVITKYRGAETELVIPSELGIHAVGEEAFKQCYKLKSIELPKGVTKIGAFAFSDCRALSEIKLPSGIAELGSGAFLNCTSLLTVILPESLTKISQIAFRGCRLQLIGFCGTKEMWYAIKKNSDWDYCAGHYTLEFDYRPKAPDVAKEFVIENGVLVKYNGNSPCVFIPANRGIHTIGDSAFDHCTALKSVTIPKSVTKISSRAFTRCRELKSVTLQKTLREICAHAFFLCTSLDTVNFCGNEQEWIAIKKAFLWAIYTENFTVNLDCDKK